MSYKKAADYDASELITQLSDIRKTVSAERKKRLSNQNNAKMVATFRSGQENAKSPSSRGGSSGKKRW